MHCLDKRYELQDVINWFNSREDVYKMIGLSTGIIDSDSDVYGQLIRMELSLPYIKVIGDVEHGTLLIGSSKETASVAIKMDSIEEIDHSFEATESFDMHIFMLKTKPYLCFKLIFSAN